MPSSATSENVLAAEPEGLSRGAANFVDAKTRDDV